LCKSTTIFCYLTHYHISHATLIFTVNHITYFTGSTILKAKLLRKKQRNIQTIPALLDRQQTAASRKTENLTELPAFQIPDDQSRRLEQDLTDLLNIFESGMCFVFVVQYLISVLHMITNIMLFNR